MSKPQEDKDPDSLDELLVLRFRRLDVLSHGLTFGLMFGLAIFVATNWLVIKGGDVVGPHLSLLNQYFLGYRVTFVGSVIGLGYGFITGFVAGGLFAIIYNFVASKAK